MEGKSEFPNDETFERAYSNWGKKDVELAYSRLLVDEQFEKLSLIANHPNFFDILNIQSWELKHSNFLAWLLNPSENHGLKELFLIRFLRDILADERTQDISILDIGDLPLDKIEVRREWQNIDILIIAGDAVFCIENKVFSKEHSKQLTRYKEIVEEYFPHHRKCFVLLTPQGTPAIEESVYIEYTYAQIHGILKVLLAYTQPNLSNNISTYIHDYLRTLELHVMDNTEEQKWAQQIYKTHRELFDFVFENKPDSWSGFAEKLNKMVVERGWILGSPNKGYVRFSTKKIDHLIARYPNANGWPLKEAFLFEFDFYSGKRILFKATISDSSEAEQYGSLLNQILASTPGAKATSAAKWRVYLPKSITFPLEDSMWNWDANIQDKLEKFIDGYVTDTVRKIEESFLNHEEEIKKALKELQG